MLCFKKKEVLFFDLVDLIIERFINITIYKNVGF